MKERIAQINAEQINIKPDQQSFLLQNADNLPLPTTDYIGDTNKINDALDDQLASNPRFIEANRNPDSQYVNSFLSIRNLLEDRNYAPMIKKYGNDYERREGMWNNRAIYESSSFLGKKRSNMNYALESIDLLAKHHALDLARESGDAQEIERALAEVQKQQEVVDNYYTAETMLGRGVASVTASIIDNPWGVIAGAGATIATGGLGAPAWVATLAGGVVGAAAAAPRSYEVMAGEAYQTILEDNPNISQAEAHKLAREAGAINTIIESIPELFSLGAVGGTTRNISKPLTRALKSARLRPGMIDNPAFKDAFKFSANKVWKKAGIVFAEHAGDSSIESVQELFQDIIIDAANTVASGKATSIGEAAIADLGQFLTDPFSPENADKIETITSTFLGTMAFSGSTHLIGKAGGQGINRIAKRTKSIGDAAIETSQNRNWFQSLFDWRQNTKAGKENSPANRVHLEQMILNNQTPSDKVYIDEAKARELSETLDANVVRLLKLDEAIANKDANGGLISIDLADYDEVVSTNGELFQQIKDNISFDPTVFSTKAFVDRIIASEKSGAELSVARADKNSVFNRILSVMSRNKNMSAPEREFSASMAQLIINRASELTNGKMSANDIYEKLVVSIGRTNPREAVLTPEQIKEARETERELKRRIRNTDVDTLGQLLVEKDFSIRGLSGKQIRALANANIDKFTLNDALVKKSVGQSIRESISNIEQNKISGDKILLDAGMKQEQIDSLSDADWSRMVRAEFARQNEEMGIMPEDSLVDDDALEALKDIDDDLLLQKTDDKIAGVFKKEGDKYIIGLTKMSNPTTFAHEMFHFFNTFLMEQYNEGKLSEYWKARAESLAEFVGGKIENGQMSFDQKAMELGADAFTNYIRQGKVPNAELRPILAFMKHLFARVYRALGLRKIRLNKRITDVFDSIFMAQTEVEQIQRNQGLLAVEKPVGADNELYDDYQKNVLTSRARASEKYVRDLQAYNVEKQSETYKKDVENLKNQIIGRWSVEPFFQAKTKYNELVAKGISPQDAETSVLSEFGGTLSQDEINTAIAFDIDKEAQTQAELEMDESIKQKYDLLDETLAEKCLKNTDKAKSLLQESLLLTGGTMQDFRQLWVEINDKVEQDVSRMEFSKAFNREFWMDAEAMAVERYLIAKQTGKMQEAADQRRTQAIITLVRMKTEAVKNRFDKFQRHARTMSGQQKTDVMDAQSYDLLQSILKAYRFPVLSRRIASTPLATKLNDWVKFVEDKYMVDFNSLRPFFPEIASGLSGTQSEMTVNQFDKLETVFNPIDKFARDMWEAKTEIDEQTKQSHIQQVIDHIEKTNARTDSKILWNSFSNPEPMLKKLNPQVVLDSYFYPLMNAISVTETKQKQMSNNADNALSKINYSAKKHVFGGVETTYKNMADLLLAMGNEHAYENMVKKLGITREQAEVMASDALTQNPKYAEFMKGIWGVYESVLPDLNKSYVETFNRIFIEKEPRKFSINGIEFEGGYVPENKHTDTIIYDQHFMPTKMGELKNEKLIVKEADGDMKSIVENIQSHIYMFSRMAYMRVAFNRAAAFFESQEYRDAVGENPSKFIKDWLERQRTPSKTDSKGLSLLSGITNSAALGWNVMRFGVQLTGIVAGAALVNPVYFGKSIPKALGLLANGKLINELKSKSAYMDARYENPIESIFGMKRSAIGALQSFQQLALMPLTWGDAVASYIVWDAQYNESLDKGRTEQQASDDADSAVRLTQSDSMTASRAKFLNSEWSRILTPFMSYIMSMQSLVRGSLMTREYGDAARVALCYIVLSPFFESIFKELSPFEDSGDDDDDNFWERVVKRYVSDATATLGTSILPVANVGGSLLNAFATGFDKGIDGKADVYKSYQMSVPLVAYLDNFRQIAEATGKISAGYYDTDKAWEKLLTGTSGVFFGTEGKKWAKLFLAGD